MTSILFVALLFAAEPIDQAASKPNSSETTPLTDSLTHFRSPTAQWTEVSAVELDPANPKLLKGFPGSGEILNGPTGRTKNLFTDEEFGDAHVHVEFMVPQGSNSGVYLQGRYEIQVLDSFGKKMDEITFQDCGGIYQRYDEQEKRGYEGHPPRVNAAKAPGQWQSYDIYFLAPRFDAEGKKIANARFVRVSLNGELLHENVEVTGPTRAAGFMDEKALGPIMLQGDHGPVAYRNLRVEPFKTP